MGINVKKVFYFINLLFIVGLSPLVSQNTISEVSYVKLGTLESFWRNEPVIGRWLSVSQGQIKIPKYMEETSFPYTKRLYEKEVPFADSLTVVRLLGGWNYTKKRGELNGQKNADLVYIKNGKMQYRWDLLKGRLDPYINVGYKNITLVLDNIPWGLTKKSKLKKYGQVNPPHDLKKWETFLEAMIHEMIKLYGYEIVKKFRFRLGTECQSRNRFNGTHGDYVNLYLSTQKAIRKVLPNAKIGPFNLAGRKEQLSKNNVDMAKFISLEEGEHLKTNTKPQVDFLPLSTYLVLKNKHKKNIRKILDARSKANRRYFDNLSMLSKKNFSKEIHEFGVLNYSIKGIQSGEPGTRGASWRMYMIQNMMENNISKLYHWGTFDRVVKDKYLLKGNGWIYAVLEHLSGGEAYSLPLITKDTIHHKTLIVKKNKRVYLLTSAFLDRKDDDLYKNITTSVPAELLPVVRPTSIKWTYLTNKTSVINVIHDDLLKKGLLDTSFLQDLNIVGRVNSMGTKAGKKHVYTHWDDYTKIITDSLTLKPFNGIVEDKEGVMQFNINISIPSVSIIELTFE